MASIERSRIQDTARAAMSRTGIPPHIEDALASLSRADLIRRCRTAADELSGFDSDHIVLRRETALAMLAACWTLASAEALRLEIRAAVLAIHQAPGESPEIRLQRLDLSHLVARTLQEQQ